MSRLAAVALCTFFSGCIFLALALTGGVDFSPGQSVLRLPMNSNPPTLDPVQITDTLSDAVGRKLFNGLVRYDADLQPAPDLAERWAWDDTTRSYTFHLRRGVLFHNGREMKAHDVKYSWERLLDPTVSRYMQILELVDGAKEKIESEGRLPDTRGLQVLDDYTFRVRLTETCPTFLMQIGMVNASVIPREAVEEAEADKSTFGRRPVGTGLFKLARWDENSRLVLKRHDAYFGGRPPLDGVIFKVVPSPPMRLARFLKGHFDVSDIPFNELKRMTEQHRDLICRRDYLRTSYVGMTMNRADKEGVYTPTLLARNPKVRQAINAAINRKHLCETILTGRSKPAQSILPPGMPGHDPQRISWVYDPARARQLLTEAGYPQGQGLEKITFLYQNDPDIKKLVLAIHYDLTSVGIPVELQSLDWAAFLDRVDKNPPDLFLISWVADYNDPDNFLYLLFHSKQWTDNNRVRYGNPEVDRLLERGRSIMDPKERMALYRRAEGLILDDLPWAILENRTNVLMVHPWVKGVRENLTAMDSGPGLNYVNFMNVDLER